MTTITYIDISEVLSVLAPKEIAKYLSLSSADKEWLDENCYIRSRCGWGLEEIVEDTKYYLEGKHIEQVVVVVRLDESENRDALRSNFNK
jgi:hypothetical protein